MSTATANAAAGSSNHRATAHRRRLRFPSPADEYRTTTRIFSSPRIELPRAKTSPRFPWPPKGRLVSRHVDGDKIVTEHAQLTRNFLREYANDVRDERRRIAQRQLDLLERLKTVQLKAKRATIAVATSTKKVADFMLNLNDLFKPDPPAQPAQQPPTEGEHENQEDGDENQGSPAGEDKENEGRAEENDDDSDSDSDDSGDEGPAAGGAVVARQASAREAGGSQREVLADLTSSADVDGEQDMDIDEPWHASPDDAEREARRKGKQREVNPEDDEESLSPHDPNYPQSSPKKRKHTDENDSEDEREVERSIDILLHPLELFSNNSSPRSPKRPRHDYGAEGEGSESERKAEWSFSDFFSPPVPLSAPAGPPTGPYQPQPSNPGPFRPPFEFPQPPAWTQPSQSAAANNVAGPLQRSSIQRPAPTRSVASSSQWQGPLPSTPPRQTGQASRRLPTFLGDLSARPPPPPSMDNFACGLRPVFRTDGPRQTVTGRDPKTGELTFAPGAPYTRTQRAAPPPPPSNRRVLQPIRGTGSTPGSTGAGPSQQPSGGSSSQSRRRSSSINHVTAPQAPAQPPAPPAGPSRWEQGLPGLLRRHDTYVEGPDPWVVINSSNYGVIHPAALVPPVAPVGQAPIVDHYPSPASSHSGLREEAQEGGQVHGEGEDDEGLEYVDGPEYNGEEEEEASYDDEEADEAW